MRVNGAVRCKSPALGSLGFRPPPLGGSPVCTASLCPSHLTEQHPAADCCPPASQGTLGCSPFPVGGSPVFDATLCTNYPGTPAVCDAAFCKCRARPLFNATGLESCCCACGLHAQDVCDTGGSGRPKGQGISPKFALSCRSADPDAVSLEKQTTVKCNHPCCSTCGLHARDVRRIGGSGWSQDPGTSPFAAASCRSADPSTSFVSFRCQTSFAAGWHAQARGFCGGSSWPKGPGISPSNRRSSSSAPQANCVHSPGQCPTLLECPHVHRAAKCPGLLGEIFYEESTSCCAGCRQEDLDDLSGGASASEPSSHTMLGHVFLHAQGWISWVQQHARNCWHAVSALDINHNYLNASRVGEASNPGPKPQAGLQAFVQQAVQKALQQALASLDLSALLAGTAGRARTPHESPPPGTRAHRRKKAKLKKAATRLARAGGSQSSDADYRAPAGQGAKAKGKGKAAEEARAPPPGKGTGPAKAKVAFARSRL